METSVIIIVIGVFIFWGNDLSGYHSIVVAGGRPKVEEILAYFPALIPKSLIQTKVEIVEGC